MKHRNPSAQKRDASSRPYAEVARTALGLAINVTGFFVLVSGLLPLTRPFA